VHQNENMDLRITVLQSSVG